MTKYLYSYASNSPSARRVAAALSAEFATYRECSEPIPGEDDVVINWGCDRWPRWWTDRPKFLNFPDPVADASNKLITFNTLSDKYEWGIYIPDYTLDQAVAKQWLNEGAHNVVGRTTFHGSRGNNIVLLNGDSPQRDWGRCVLFTVHIPNVREARVHVLNGRAFLAHRKRRRRGRVYQRPLIKNYEQGWVFCNYPDIPDEASRMAENACRALELDFGAVDMVYNRYHDQWYVLEVNTAPNLTGASLDAFVNAMNEYLSDPAVGQDGGEETV